MSVITYTVNGIVGALPPGAYSSYYTGIDYSGIFGPPGASLVGDHFWTTWTGTICDCIGVNDPNSPLHLYDGYAYPSPVIDVTLQIGDQPYGHNPVYDFGGNNVYGMTRDDPGFIWWQAGYSNGTIASGGNGSTSGFNIGQTSGLLTQTAVGIPAPSLGEGWLGLAFVIPLLWLYARHRPLTGANTSRTCEHPP